jgi:hypothetical protein
MRAGGRLTLKDIEGEFRAVSNLCMENPHKNIVQVLRYGALPDSPNFFLDMEMCTFNLEYCIREDVRAFAEWVAFEASSGLTSVSGPCRTTRKLLGSAKMFPNGMWTGGQ